MKVHNVSLKRFANYLQLFCFAAFLLIAGSAWFVTDFFAFYEKETEQQSAIAQNIAQKIDQSLLPISAELSEIKGLLTAFSSELALLSIDSERSFDQLEKQREELASQRGALIDNWPEGLLNTSLLERITSNIIISEDIAIEVLDRRDSNYTYRLYEESIEIIAQILADTDSVLDAVSGELRALAARGYEVSERSMVETAKQQERLQFGVMIFILLSLILFSVIVFLLLVFTNETRRRFDLLRRFAHSVESGYYDQSILLVARDASGQLARSLESMSRKLVELLQESEELAEQAQESSKAKSEFLASMSHEIRTPMNGVIGLLDILNNDKLDDEQKRYVRLAQSSATSLLGVINDILDFSKIESGKLTLEHIEFNLAETLEDFVALMSVSASEQNLQLHFHASGIAEQPFVKSDPMRLRQILTNLVGNALKFTHEGEINIEAELLRDSGWLRISVSDTGIGIPEEKLKNLFDSFTQVDASTTRKYGGSGLGLTISNQLIDLMGGDTLHVASALGEGSRFWFEVQVEPVTKQVEELAGVTLEGEVELPVVEAVQQQVLLVEDNAVNQVVAQTLIEAEGFAVTIAENGQVALDLLKAGPNDFCLVFMDCQMPVMDGYTATQEIRAGACGEECISVPIIAMTANAMAGDRERCIESGMDDYISKPIDASKLSEMLVVWTQEDRRSEHAIR